MNIKLNLLTIRTAVSDWRYPLTIVAVGFVFTVAYCCVSDAEPAKSKFASGVKSGVGGVAGGAQSSEDLRVTRKVGDAGNRKRGEVKLPLSELASKRGQRVLPAAEIPGKRETSEPILTFPPVKIDDFRPFAPGRGTGATPRTGAAGAAAPREPRVASDTGFDVTGISPQSRRSENI